MQNDVVALIEVVELWAVLVQRMRQVAEFDFRAATTVNFRDGWTVSKICGVYF
jgi:hypothetical protein